MYEPQTDMHKLADELPAGLYIVDLDRRITYWNKAAERITGFSAAEVIGHHCSDNVLVHVDGEGCALCGKACPLAETIQSGEPREGTVYMHHKQGHRIPVFVRLTPLHDGQGQLIGGIELFSDASSSEVQREKIASLEKLALTDELTQLPNRRQVEAECAAGLSMLRSSGVPFGLIFMDIDHFKRFNDDFGHDVVDLALKTVADTFRSAIRPFDCIGRWGGEEFIAVLPNADAALLEATAERIRNMVRTSHVEVGREVCEKAPEDSARASETALRVTISLGGTIAKPDDDIESIVQRADAMLYVSKGSGRDRVTLG